MLHVKWYSLAFAVVVSEFVIITHRVIILAGSLINYPCIVAIQLQTFSNYLMQGLELGTIENEWWARKLIEILLLWMITFINCFSLKRIVSKFNIVSSFAKIVVIGIILVIGGVYLFKGNFDVEDHLWFVGNVKNFKEPFHVDDDHQFQASGLIGAFFAALFTYDGWVFDWCFQFLHRVIL